MFFFFPFQMGGGPSRTRHFFVFIEAGIQNETMLSRRATPKAKTFCCGDVIAQKKAFINSPEAVAMHGNLEVDLRAQESFHTHYSVLGEYKFDGNSLLPSVKKTIFSVSQTSLLFDLH